jgi:signal transduction histidine kinase
VPVERSNHPDLATVVLDGLGMEGGVQQMLACIADCMSACGCVLWEASPYSDFSTDPPRAQLYAVASFFTMPGDAFTMHNLSLEDSATGFVVRTTRPQFGSDGTLHGRIVEHPYLQAHRITQLCAVPINLTGTQPGALTVYRRTGEPPFKEDDEHALVKIARIVPPIFASVREKAILALISQVEQILQRSERADAQPLTPQAKREVLRTICDAVAETFHCLEVSLFLEDLLEPFNLYALQATTWGGSIPVTALRGEISEGLTGYALAHSKELFIFNLLTFEQDKASIHRVYPRAQWNNSLRITEAAMRHFRKQNTSELPPISFMACPVQLGGALLGVIRCSAATEGPFYFSHREVELLRLVAAQIAQCWVTWCNRRQMHAENTAWRELTHSIGHMNQTVMDSLQSSAVSELQILDRALASLHKGPVSGAEVHDILIYEKPDTLRFAAVKTTKGQTPMASLPVYSLKKDANSAVVRSFNTGKQEVVEAALRDTKYGQIFPDIARRMVVPLAWGNERLGVMNVALHTPHALSSPSVSAIFLIARQFSLYHRLVNSVCNLRNAELSATTRLGEIERLQETQRKIFQDLAHQIKGPSAQAQMRAELCVRSMETDNDRREVLPVRGLTRKVRRVAYSLGILTAVESGTPIPVTYALFDVGKIMRMLNEAAEDAALVIEEGVNLQFKIRHAPFSEQQTNFKIDYDLLEHVINNIFDNAVKYSYPDTDIFVGAGLNAKGEYRIVIQNEGLPLTSDDTRKATEREWRGELAKEATGEGSGIGLFVVDRIMTRLGGRLEITPTTPEGITAVRLQFPALKG